MTERIYQADLNQDIDQVRELFWEYLQWANARVNDNFGVSFDIKTMLAEDMRSLDKFLPPRGRLLLCERVGEPAGLACLRDLGDGVGEIKRMYVRPTHRRQGVGGALLNRLLEEANTIGYRCIRLDSARFMREAHRLYCSFGFQQISPYSGSEIPAEFQENWIFMEKTLVD
jgi:GNAT superfamily N-acetyltransferase